MLVYVYVCLRLLCLSTLGLGIVDYRLWRGDGRFDIYFAWRMLEPVLSIQEARPVGLSDIGIKLNRE